MKLSEFIISFLFLYLFLAISSCSEVIDLDSETNGQILVVDGRVTNGSIGNEVRLALTSNINNNQRPVIGAELILFENGAELGRYNDVLIDPGNYRLNLPNHNATVGATYELQIELPDGRQYRTEPAQMPARAAVDQLRFEVKSIEEEVGQFGASVQKNVVSLFSDATVLDQDRDFYLRWEIFETYVFEERLRVVGPFDPLPVPCYITNRLTGREVILFNGAEVKVPVIPDLPLMTTEVDSRFVFNYLFNVVQFSTNADTYRYRSQVDELANLEGSIFDTPPGPIVGNISNVNDPDEQVLGYFEVVRADTTWQKVVRDDIPFNVEIFCPAVGFNPALEPPECTDCLLIENSTIFAPYYWF